MKQQARIKLTVVVILCFIVLVVFGFAWKMNQPVPMSAEDLRINGAIELSTPRIFSDFDLVDHNGEPFTLDSRCRNLELEPRTGTESTHAVQQLVCIPDEKKRRPTLAHG